MTVYHFTCACGRDLRVDASSIFMANLAAIESGWKIDIEPPLCSECLLKYDGDRGALEQA